MKTSVSSLLLIVLSTAIFLFGVGAVAQIIPLQILSPVLIMVNLPSLAIIIGGVLTHAAASYPAGEVISALSKTPWYFSHSKYSGKRLQNEIARLMEWHNGLRHGSRDYATRLCTELGNSYEGYLFSLISTNYSAQSIRELGETKIEAGREQCLRTSRMFTLMGNASPAYGMMGTLIGLIVMLQNYQDTQQLSLGMSVALMTTFYGIFLSQFLWYPLARKTEEAADREVLREQLLLNGLTLMMEDQPPLFVRDYLEASI